MHGFFNDPFRFFLDEPLKIDGLDPAGISRMTLVYFVFCLVAGDPDLSGVNDHDIITGIQVRGIFGFMFAAQTPGNFGREPAQGLAAGINDIPVTPDIRRSCNGGFHFGYYCVIAIAKRGGMVRTDLMTVNITMAEKPYNVKINPGLDQSRLYRHG